MEARCDRCRRRRTRWTVPLRRRTRQRPRRHEPARRAPRARRDSWKRGEHARRSRKRAGLRAATVVGVYVWQPEHRSPDLPARRVLRHGCRAHDPSRPLDHGILRTRWLDRAQLLARRRGIAARSSQRCVDDYLAGIAIRWTCSRTCCPAPRSASRLPAADRQLIIAPRAIARPAQPGAAARRKRPKRGPCPELGKADTRSGKTLAFGRLPAPLPVER
jgi:hypothetical protein